MATRQKGESDVRERILEAAFSAFMQHGFSRASTLDIATRAKVSKRELYAHFRDKNAMFAAGVAARMQRVAIAFAFPEVATPATLEKALKDLGTAVLTAVTHPHVLAVHRLAIAESARSPALGAALDEQGRGANRARLERFLRKAQMGGLLSLGKADEMAELFFALLWTDLFPRLLLRARSAPDASEIIRRANRASHIFLTIYRRNGN